MYSEGQRGEAAAGAQLLRGPRSTVRMVLLRTSTHSFICTAHLNYNRLLQTLAHYNRNCDRTLEAPDIKLSRSIFEKQLAVNTYITSSTGVVNGFCGLSLRLRAITKQCIFFRCRKLHRRSS